MKKPTAEKPAAKLVCCALGFLIVLAGVILFFGQFRRETEAVKLSWSASNPNGWTFYDESGNELTAEEASSYTGTLRMDRTVDALPERMIYQYANLSIACSNISDLTASLDGVQFYAAPGDQGGTLRISLPREYAGHRLSLSWTQDGTQYVSLNLLDMSIEALRYAASDAEWLIPMTAFAIIAVLVLGLFLLSGALSSFQWPLLLLLLGPLSQTLYWARNYWSITISTSPALTAITYLALLFFWAPPLFLLIQSKPPKLRCWLVAWAVFAVLDFALMPLLTFGVRFLITLPQWALMALVNLPYLLKWLGVAMIALSSVLAFRRKNAFFRLFTPFYLAAIPIVVVYAFVKGNGFSDLCLSLPGTPLYILAVISQVLALSVSLVDFIRRTAQQETELSVLSVREQLSRQQLAVLEESSESLRKLRHDMINHFTVLQTLYKNGETERLQEYLSDLTAQADAVPSTTYAAHPTVNAILTVMLARAKSQGTEIVVKVALPEQLPVTDTDLCTLLMNLLENALEANEKAPEGAKPWMRVIIHIKGSFLYIGVENSRFSPVAFDQDSLCQTTKADQKAHGFGLKSAQAVARKYQGELLLQAPEGSFSASTALQISE